MTMQAVGVALERAIKKAAGQPAWRHAACRTTGTGHAPAPGEGTQGRVEVLLGAHMVFDVFNNSDIVSASGVQLRSRCMQHLMCCNVQTRKLDTLAIDILELQMTLPWRPSPKSGSRVNVLTSGVRATLRYDTAGSAVKR